MRRTAVLAVASAAVSAFAAGLAFWPSPAPRTPVVVDQVRAQLAARYYRAVPQRVLGRPTIAGILAGLHDRYTRLLTPSEYLVARRGFAGRYGGVGLMVLPSPDGLLVRRTLSGPAQIAGIRPGDTIMTVDGAPTAALTFDEAMGRILGQPGSTVTLRVLRGGRVLSFRLVRRVFRVPAVGTRLLGRVGLIDLNSFSRRSARQTTAAYRRLRREGANAIVLDLRENPGGLLNEAVGVASLFLGRGESIVSLAGAHRPLKIVYSRGGGASTVPLVVLVDGDSASAAEIVAGALHDHGRATVVGERTFGKSLVQEIVRLPSGAALTLTVARYLTPAGVDLSHGGLQPDVRSRHPLAAALKLLARRRS